MMKLTYLLLAIGFLFVMSDRTPLDATGIDDYFKDKDYIPYDDDPVFISYKDGIRKDEKLLR